MSERLWDRKRRWQRGLLRGGGISASLEAEEEQNWLITLGDLLSLLLIFFIVFMALSRLSTPGKGSRTPPPSPQAALPSLLSSPPLASLQKEMRAAIGALNLGDQVIVQAQPQEVLIILKEAVTFPSGEAEILKNSQPILSAIAEVIRRHPAFQVEIEGHTDDRPIRTGRFPSNWELSVARAAAVLKYLIEGEGMDPSRFSIMGYGEQRPSVPNLSEALRAQNRRVEIRLKNRLEEPAAKPAAENPVSVPSTAQASKISRTF